MTLDGLLRDLEAREGSDLHLIEGRVPKSRVHGALEPVLVAMPLQPPADMSVEMAMTCARYLIITGLLDKKSCRHLTQQFYPKKGKSVVK